MDEEKVDLKVAVTVQMKVEVMDFLKVEGMVRKVVAQLAEKTVYLMVYK